MNMDLSGYTGDAGQKYCYKAGLSGATQLNINH